MERLGTNYGGWWVPNDMDLRTVYSVGVGEDISFDLQLQSKYNCDVYLMDPTPRAKIHVDEYLSGKSFTGDIQKDYLDNIKNLTVEHSKLHFIPKGLWDHEGKLKFYKQSNDQYVSRSLVDGMFSDSFDVVEVTTLPTDMTIDLLKMDIEGAECRVLNHMLDSGIKPKYLLVEFDLLQSKKDTTGESKKTIERLMRSGYKLLKNDNWNVSFEYKPSIPVVIIHRGYKPYVHKVCKRTSETNKVILIGDEPLKDVPPGVEFVDIRKYEVPQIKKVFKNYSTNNADYEFECYHRVFILKNFMLQRGYERAFHLDSDCVLLKDINTFKFTGNVAYCIPKNHHEFRMSSSIHCGLLDINFCNEFEKLYFEIYESGNSFDLIKGKIDWHITSGNPGGICDMTLYYILQRDRIKVQNLLEYGFMNNINSDEGPDDKGQYRMKNGIIEIDTLFEIYDSINSCKVSIWNIHYQGGAKMYI